MDRSTRTAVITGGGQGIGKAIAQAYLSDGMNVIIAELDEEAGNETAAELNLADRLQFIRTDVSDESSVRTMINKTIEIFTRIDILVNNAAIAINKSINELSLNEWNRVISVNLTGPFLCSKYAAPYLKQNKGCIINIASTRAFMSEPDTEAYTASKGGIAALTHALALSLGPDVRVNSISPGWIDVSGWKKKSGRYNADLSKADQLQHPAGRAGMPQDIASLALFLASPGNSFITGANFMVDGGMTKKMIYGQL